MNPSLLQPLNIQTISVSRLLRKIDVALGASASPHTGADDPHTSIATPQEHFRVVRRVLVHLLGNDITFSTSDLSTPDARQSQRLALLYRSAAARKLYTDVMGAPHARVSPWSLHQFFARIAWLDESAVTTTTAKEQLADFLYGPSPFWKAKLTSGQGAYSELGGLLTSVPRDLRRWMVQFKRGARLVPVDEWIALSSGRAVYDSLVASPNPQVHQSPSTVLSVFTDVIADMLPADQYRDKAALDSLRQHLITPAAWAKLDSALRAMPANEEPETDLRCDAATHMALSTRIEFLRKAAQYAVNPGNERWLDSAIGKARNASGMRGLSLAMRLRFEHPELAFESAITLGILLLAPLSPSPTELGDVLLTAQALNIDVPRMESWSTLRNADEVFKSLGMALLCNVSDNDSVLRFTARETWHALIHTAQFQALFEPLLHSLGWYGGHANEHASPRITQALAGRAIVDFFLGANGTDSESLAKTLRRGWVCGYSHVQLCEKIRGNILARQPHASSSTRDMLYHLLLREAMPELLVEGVPDHLQYGRSLQSVALIHGVALLEAMTSGLSQSVTYDELIKTSATFAQSADPAVHAAWARTLVVPALRYATADGFIKWSGEDDLQQATATQVNQALSYLHEQQNAHADELNDLLSLKSPDRKHFARQMLTDAGVDRRLWDQAIKVHRWPVLQEHGFTVAWTYLIDRLKAAGKPQATVLELVMMGEVYVAGKPTVPQAYASAFDTFRKALVAAESAVVNRLLREMQPEDRAVLLESTCEVSRVSFDQEQGLYGLFIRCQKGDHSGDFHGHSVPERFFELIPAAGVAREITQKFNYYVEAVTWNGAISITEALRRKKAHEQRLVQASNTPLLPMDSDAYLKGTVSRSRTLLHNPRHGQLIPSARLLYLPDATEKAYFESLAVTAADHLLASFLEQTQAEHQHETQWEGIWAKEAEFADMAARLLIPFYGCIKDLAAGDRSGWVVAGCLADVAFALVPMGQFVGSTARIILRAGEMSVESVARLTGAALSRLVKGLAEQSAVMLVRDLGAFVLKVGRLGWATLLEALPSLRKVFSSQSMLATFVSFDKGVYRVAESLEQQWLSASMTVDKSVILDGQHGVAVRNVGGVQAPDFRLLDPEADSVFGKKLTIISEAQPVELSTVSALDSIGTHRYPAVLPVMSTDQGFFEVLVAQDCRVRIVNREEGVFDILIDDQIYRLDANTPGTALRKLTAEKLSSRSGLLEEVVSECRVRRDLIQLPCPSGIKLSTPTPEPVTAGSTSPKRSGKYPSNAMDAREFMLARLAHSAEPGAPGIDVFVNEGKYCKWAEPSGLEASTSVSGKRLVVLSEAERVRYSLPEKPVYLQQFDGVMASEGRLGLPENYDPQDIQFIYEHAPVIELGGIVSGIDDSRTLRGIRMTIDDAHWTFIEPDTGVVYKAQTPQDGTHSLKFSKVADSNQLNEFFRLSEEYRLVRERPGVLTDQENIARLLFDLLDEPERAAWSLSWAVDLRTYDQYAQWCIARKQKNELLTFATNILAGEEIQKKFVTLAKDSIPDFQQIAIRSVPDQQHVVETLNQLLPVQGSSARWEVLNVQNIVMAKTAKNILKEVKGANLSFAQIYTEDGQRIVYYALSGGRKSKGLKLQLDVAGSTERVIDGVIYRDARARMVDRPADTSFTSLPVIRTADRVLIKEFNRQLDSERLIATVLRADMKTTRLSEIKVFTVMDTCRSCGGFVLPRLKLDFPDAKFSVTYLKNYLNA